MGNPAAGYKVVYGIWCFHTYDDGVKTFHGKLNFSSFEKLDELCPWRDKECIIAKEVVKDDFDDMDYVPDNF